MERRRQSCLLGYIATHRAIVSQLRGGSTRDK